EVGLMPLRLTQVVGNLGWERAKDVPEVRRTLQRLGVAIRELDTGFWLHAAARTIEAALGGGRPVVVTDVRFPNEAEYIRRKGGGVPWWSATCGSPTRPRTSGARGVCWCVSSVLACIRWTRTSRKLRLTSGSSTAS